MGFEFSNGNNKPYLNILRSFRDWRILTTKTPLQKILGTVNWYRGYINNISGRFSHLYDKLKRSKRNIKSEPDEMKEIHEIYEVLKNKAKLNFPDMSKIFLLNTDASENGVDAILYQKQGIIGYYSKKLSGSQKNYSEIEKEVLAIYLAVNHFRKWLIGNRLEMYTDNLNLLGNNENYDKNTARWCAELYEFDITMKNISYLVRILLYQTVFRDIRIKDSPYEHREKNMNIDWIKTKIRKFHIEYGHPERIVHVK